MRIDKYLQITRIIKRRANAKDMVVQGRVIINGKVAKPATSVKVNDEIELHFGNVLLRVKVLAIKEKIKKEEANELFEIIAKESV